MFYGRCANSEKNFFVMRHTLLSLGPVVYRGDLIGCWADFDEASNDQIPIHFTLNGHKVAQVLISMEADKSDLFPFVGMKHKGIRVLAKVSVL